MNAICSNNFTGLDVFLRKWQKKEVLLAEQALILWRFLVAMNDFFFIFRKIKQSQSNPHAFQKFNGNTISWNDLWMFQRSNRLILLKITKIPKFTTEMLFILELGDSFASVSVDHLFSFNNNSVCYFNSSYHTGHNELKPLTEAANSLANQLQRTQ